MNPLEKKLEKKEHSSARTIHPGHDYDMFMIRRFTAAREEVFTAWINEKKLAQWWGPQGFTNPVCELDVRPGGDIIIDMQAPDGTIYPMRGVFSEIVKPERLVFSSSALDETGAVALEDITTVSFEEIKNSSDVSDVTTEVTIQSRIISASERGKEYLRGQDQGWSESLERLTELLHKH